MRINKNQNGISEEWVFAKLRSPTPLLDQRSKRVSLRSSLAQWIYSQREHGNVGKTNILWKTIVDTDLMLYFYAQKLPHPIPGHRHHWPPLCEIYRTYELPSFISSAVRRSEANKLIDLFDLKDIPQLKTFIREAVESETRYFDILHSSRIDESDIEKISTM